LKIGPKVPELEDLEKWHFPLTSFIALTTVSNTVLHCDKADATSNVQYCLRYRYRPCVIFQQLIEGLEVLHGSCLKIENFSTQSVFKVYTGNNITEILEYHLVPRKLVTRQ